MSKLSKTAQIIVVAFLLVVVLMAVLSSVRSQQMAERNKLAVELALAGKKLSLPQNQQLYRQKADLEKRLSQAAAKADTEAGNTFSTSQSIAATDILIDIAASLGVEVTEVRSPGPARENLRGVRMLALPINLKVEGDLEYLTYFIADLSERFPTCMVKSVEIAVPQVGKPAAVSGTGEPPIAKPSMTMQLVIYTYDGEANG